jgi:hypothetical protein
LHYIFGFNIDSSGPLYTKTVITVVEAQYHSNNSFQFLKNQIITSCIIILAFWSHIQVYCLECEKSFSCIIFMIRLISVCITRDKNRNILSRKYIRCDWYCELQLISRCNIFTVTRTKDLINRYDRFNRNIKKMWFEVTSTGVFKWKNTNAYNTSLLKTSNNCTLIRDKTDSF